MLHEMRLRPDLVVLLAETGRVSEARPYLERCRDVLAEGEDWRGLGGGIAVAEAALRSAEGRLKEMGQWFQSAIETFRHYTLPWDEADALLRWGRALLNAGDRAGAAEMLDGAAEIYQHIGAGRPWLELVQRERERPQMSTEREPPR